MPSELTRLKGPRAAREGASQAAAGPLGRLSFYLNHHRLMAVDSLVRLLTNLSSSLMTWSVIGIAVALPAWFYVVLRNAEQLSVGWQGQPRISVFLQQSVIKPQGRELSERLQTWKSISRTTYISQEDALREFETLSGFTEIVDSLDENPLPAVIVVLPSDDRAATAEQLFARLMDLPEVESGSLDMQWVRRLYSILHLAERSVVALTSVLAVAVMLVIGNTTRLAIESRRTEIEVIKLVGGSDAFVRRPFLYTGIWFGVGGGLLALVLVEVSLAWLSGPVKQLTGAYNSDFLLLGLGLRPGLTLLAGSALLGLAGAWLAVDRHLNAIEPH
mgnify:CR=1 FL=1